MRSSPLLGVEVLPLAYDRMGSVRTFDEDGRLKVKQTNLSKACINPYKGSEIPDWKALGLDPDKIYNLLRCPKALEKGAASFDSLPVLLEHVHVSATHPRHDLVVGATGSNTVFQSPYLESSLSIWDQKAIDKINREEQRELSCAYRYVPKMEAGFYQGKPYDGIMTEIRGNHVALVRKGRAGSDVLVADASPYDADTLFPLLQAFRSFCPHATDMEIRHVVARLIGELTSVPEQEDFLPSVSLWSKKKVPAANNITQDENLNHLPKGTPDGGEFASKNQGEYASISQIQIISPQQSNPAPFKEEEFYPKQEETYHSPIYPIRRGADLHGLFNVGNNHDPSGSVPWLESHEGINGSHTMERHVGKSIGYMKRRFKFEPKLKATGTFPDGETAAKTIWEAIQMNENKIMNGLNKNSKKIEFEFDAGYPIGKVLKNDGGKIAHETSKIWVVLRPDNKGRYIIHTAYPIL
ncbi:DUF2213 domain-containing protein [Acetobacteraceae bacterium]|nr:DUF2213 domain-containing protein [Acetobacteraceae bacterium]